MRVVACFCVRLRRAVAGAQVQKARACAGAWVNIQVKDSHGPSNQSMPCPHVPRYVSTGLFPVEGLADLNNEPNLANVIAHQKDLEMLSF